MMVEFQIPNDHSRSVFFSLCQPLFVNRRSKFVLKTCLIAVSVLALLVFLSFSSAADDSSDTLTIYTVNYPLQYFAERIAGEHAIVIFPAPSGVDPAYWMPDREAIRKYQKADLIALNGAGYARWREKVSLPWSKTVNTSTSFKDRLMETSKTATHSHGPGEKHAHGTVAFTTWIDFSQAVEQADAIRKALSLKRPRLALTFSENYKALEKELMELDSEVMNIVAEKQDRPVIGSHPVYQYFSRRYNANIRSVHWEPDEVPDTGQWQNLQNILRENPARWMIWESEPLKESQDLLAAVGVRSIVFDPCGNVPDDGDFLTVMKRNVEELSRMYE